MNKRMLIFGATITTVLLIVVATLMPVSQTAFGAPVAVPTPIAATAQQSKGVPQLVTFFDHRALTADTTAPCVDLGNYSVADFEWVIDQGTVVNTTTLTLQFGNTTGALFAGVNLVAANAADATSGGQFNLFNRYTCPLANVTNGNTITITLNAWVK